MAWFANARRWRTEFAATSRELRKKDAVTGRKSKMKTIKCEVTFLTPAFLGNAHQDGQWRTPPFKALLRQWWRVAWAARNNFSFDIDVMRKKEGELFGNAASNGESSKSKVLLRLEAWSGGDLTSARWSQEIQRLHGRARGSNNRSGAKAFDPMLYAGYGLLKSASKMDEKRASAIKPEQSNSLRIALPDSDKAECKDIEMALSLMHLYGALGGRSRNGWGSIELTGIEAANHPDVLRDWRKALGEYWPHAIGKDESGDPLVWKTKQSFENWKDLMENFGKIRKEIRKVIKAPRDNKRLPNTIRFKARRQGNPGNLLKGMIFHMPCRPTEDSAKTPSERDWKKIHDELDKTLSRSME